MNNAVALLNNSEIKFKQFTPEDEVHIANFAKNVDLNKFENLQNFGKSPQAKLLNLRSVSDVNETKIREIDKNLAKLLQDMSDCKKITATKNPIVKWWNKQKWERLTSEQFIEEVKNRLTSDQKYIADALKTNRQNSEYLLNIHKELSMYIKASDDIKAKNSDHPNLYLLDIRRNELQSTSTVIVQILTQLKIIETLYTGVVNKINSVQNTVIPLWSAQFTITYQLGKLSGLANTVNNVIDASNNMIVGNAEKLQSTASKTIDTVFRESVDIEKIKYAGDTIANTIEEIRCKAVEHIDNVKDNVEELRRIEENLVNSMNGVKVIDQKNVFVKDEGGLTY